MNVSYRGIQGELAPKLQEKLETKFSKLSKLLERRGEKEAHVVVTTERHLHKAEITVQFYDHQLVGIGSDADLFTAMSQALDKIETQAVKQRTKWLEKTRRADTPEPSEEEPSGETALNQTRREISVFPVNHHDQRKPITLEEALIEIEANSNLDYLVYRDSDKACVSVLVRRRDGHYDLIES